MDYQRKFLDDTVTLSILCELSALKLSVIICNDLMWKTKFRYNVIHYELCYLIGGYDS